MLDEFNWALDWFDPLRARQRRGRPAGGRGRRQRAALTFDELATRSDQLANWLRAQGVARGDRIVLMLGNQVELWETMLAAMKLGAVVIPATTLLAESDLRDRIDRGDARHVIVRAADAAKFDGVPGSLHADRGRRRAVDGWLDYALAYAAPADFAPDGVDPRLRPAAPVLHVGHDRAAEARRAHPRVLSRSATSRRCTGSACSPATCT